MSTSGSTRHVCADYLAHGQHHLECCLMSSQVHWLCATPKKMSAKLYHVPCALLWTPEQVLWVFVFFYSGMTWADPLALLMTYMTYISLWHIWHMVTLCKGDPPHLPIPNIVKQASSYTIYTAWLLSIIQDNPITPASQRPRILQSLLQLGSNWCYFLNKNQMSFITTICVEINYHTMQ